MNKIIKYFYLKIFNAVIIASDLKMDEIGARATWGQSPRSQNDVVSFSQKTHIPLLVYSVCISYLINTFWCKFVSSKLLYSSVLDFTLVQCPPIFYFSELTLHCFSFILSYAFAYLYLYPHFASPLAERSFVGESARFVVSFEFFVILLPPRRRPISLGLIYFIIFLSVRLLLHFKSLLAQDFRCRGIFILVSPFDHHVLKKGLSVKLHNILWVLNILNSLPSCFLSFDLPFIFVSPSHLYFKYAFVNSLSFMISHQLDIWY